MRREEKRATADAEAQFAASQKAAASASFDGAGVVAPDAGAGCESARFSMRIVSARTCQKVCFTTVGFLALPYCLSYVLLTRRPWT